MLLERVAELSPLNRFLYWMRERHRIYLRRQAGLPAPWTDDTVLQNYFFTNPYRENDKVTAWFRQHIREPLQDDPAVLFATICFRWFNWPETGWHLMNYQHSKPHGKYQFGLLESWNTERAVETLEELKKTGSGQIFTGAFNISNSGSTKPKINRVCEDYIGPAWEHRNEFINNWDDSVTMEGMHSGLMMLPGMGGSGFMAYEVVCDLRWTYLLRNASDIMTWCNPGPGAKRGINRVMERPLEATMRRDEWDRLSRRLLGQANAVLGSLMPPLEMREIEHSLCEFDKYERARLGDGHMKRRYNATGGRS